MYGHYFIVVLPTGCRTGVGQACSRGFFQQTPGLVVGGTIYFVALGSLYLPPAQLDLTTAGYISYTYFRSCQITGTAYYR